MVREILERRENMHSTSKMSKKELTLAITLALSLGGGLLSTYAEPIQGQKQTKGDWTLGEELHMEKSHVTADRVSLDGSSVLAADDPVMLRRSTLEGKKGIQISNLTVQFPDTYYAPSGVKLLSSTLAAPVISISGVISSKDNQVDTIIGLYSEPVEDDATRKMVQNNLKTDWLHVDGVTTDTALQVYGTLLGAADLSPYTEGGKTNVTVENVANTTDSPNGSLAFGLGNSLGMINLDNPEESKDIPFVVTGKTQIRNISSTKGSAVGAVLYAISRYDMDHSHTDFHDLEISDIHGGDLSVGLYGGFGVVNVGNADINMTGKDNEYAGLYTASAPDYQAAYLKQFAIAGPFFGKINFNNPDGSYTINGNVIADAGTQLQKDEVAYQYYKNQYENSENSEGQREYAKELMDGLEPTIQFFKEKQYGSINLAGHLKLYGDIYAKNGGTVNIHLQDGSYFEGQADDYADFDAAGQLTPRKVDVSSDLNKSALGKLYNWKLQEDYTYVTYGVPRLYAGTINLTMDPGSKWQTRGKSFITSLDFNHGGAGGHPERTRGIRYYWQAYRGGRHLPHGLIQRCG